MKPLFPALVLALLAGSAFGKSSRVTDPAAARALPDAGAVAVSWTDPAQFSEIRLSRNRFEAQRGDWVRLLAEHLRKRASRQLPEGERLEVQITDIERAGEYEPENGVQFNSVRIMRDIYPPRINLDFKRLDRNGQVIAQGERKLKDLLYLSNTGMGSDSDQLRYEKRLLDDWLRREFGAVSAR